ncbi:hypothetical protein Q8F55_003921 [Vanrija albida]|uniref:F-type H+-transporting ATPase subunit H n=1 Tax=Vanrija albida TaxID=181172 RepID=A0ABR3Q5W3_9TREE
MSLLRLSAQRVAAPVFARSFSVSAARGDLVKDLYVQQLKAYKAPPPSADAKSAVRSYSAPAVPKAPVLPTDLASELSKFDATEPTLGNNAAPASAPADAESGETAADYLKFLEADIPKAEHH